MTLITALCLCPPAPENSSVFTVRCWRRHPEPHHKESNAPVLQVFPSRPQTNKHPQGVEKKKPSIFLSAFLFCASFTRPAVLAERAFSPPAALGPTRTQDGGGARPGGPRPQGDERGGALGADQRQPSPDLLRGPAMHPDPVPEAGPGPHRAGRGRDPFVPQPHQPLHENQ